MHLVYPVSISRWYLSKEKRSAEPHGEMIVCTQRFRTFNLRARTNMECHGGYSARPPNQKVDICWLN